MKRNKRFGSQNGTLPIETEAVTPATEAKRGFRPFQLIGSPLRALNHRFELTKAENRMMLGVATMIWFWMLVYALTAYHPKYVANSMVIVKDSAVTNRYVVPETNYSASTTTSSTANPVLNTLGLLHSSAIMTSLWGFLKDNHPEQLKKLHIKDANQWEMFYRDGSSLIKSKNMPGTDLISVQFAWTNPTIAKEGLDNILQTFQDESQNVNRAEQKKRSAYLDEQVKSVSKRLAEVRKHKSSYKTAKNTVDITQESEELATNRIQLATQLNEVLAEANGKQAELSRYQQMMGMSTSDALKGAAVGQNATMAKLQSQEYDLSQNYSFLKTTLTDKNPKVMEVKAQLDQIREQLKRETDRTLGKGHHGNTVAITDVTRGSVINSMATAQAQARSLNTQAATIRQRLAQLDRQAHDLPMVEAGLASIDQDERSLSTALDQLHQREIEAHLKEAETVSNVFVVDPPRLPLKAQFPRPIHLAVLSVLLGIVGGIASVILKRMLVRRRLYQALPSDPFPNTAALNGEREATLSPFSVSHPAATSLQVE